MSCTCVYDGDGWDLPKTVLTLCKPCQEQEELDSLESNTVFGVCPFCFSEGDEPAGAFWHCARCQETVVLAAPDELCVWAGQ